MNYQSLYKIKKIKHNLTKVIIVFLYIISYKYMKNEKKLRGLELILIEKLFKKNTKIYILFQD